MIGVNAGTHNAANRAMPILERAVRSSGEIPLLDPPAADLADKFYRK